MDEVKVSTLKEHEKFWAFIFLILVILALVLLSQLMKSGSPNPATDVVLNAKLRIIDTAIGGLMTIGGMAAQALFRAGQTDKDIASTLKTLSDKAVPATGEAREALLDPPAAPAAPAEEGAAPWTR